MNRTALTLARALLLASTFGGAILATGCGGDQVKTSQNGGPAWIDQGAQAFKDGKFYGVGVDTGTTNISLRRSAADAKARAELSKQFSTKVKNLIKTYDASTQDESREAGESHRQEATKAFTEMELSGTTICDRFYDKEMRAQYSLACMDPEAFGNQLDQMKQLSARAKQIIRANADKAFKEIDEESARNAAQ